MNTSFISSNLQAAEHLLQEVLKDHGLLVAIEKFISLAVETYQQEGKILLCGNGGSLCDATHCAEELTGRFHKDRPPLPALAINDAAHISCVANDYGYTDIFSRAVEAWGNSPDLFIAISTSGNSENIIKAVKTAKHKHITTVGLLGKDGGKLKELVDLPLIIPSNTTERIQEVHIKIIHLFIEGIERALFPHLYSNL